jgi:hypothetical protein
VIDKEISRLTGSPKMGPDGKADDDDTALSKNVSESRRYYGYIPKGGGMKIITRILLMSVVVAYIGFVDVAQAAPYKGNHFPSDEQIQRSLAPNEKIQPIGKHGVGPGEYKYFIVKKMPNGKEVIVALQIIQLDSGIWLISAGADEYVMINQ